MADYKLVTIGAGPAALTTAIYTTREDIDTTLFERGAVGGMAAITDHIDNYPGFAEGVSGFDLSNAMRKQAERFGAKIKMGEVSGLKRLENGDIELIIDGKKATAEAVLIGTGSDYNKLNIPNEAEYYARGVHYCATCDGAFYRDKVLSVIGGGNSAVQETIFLTRFASKIHLIVRSKFRASDVLMKELQKYIDEGKVVAHVGNVPKEIAIKDDKVCGVLTTKENKEELIESDGVFVFIGLRPNTGFLKNTDIELDEVGLIKTNNKLETSVKGIFAAGDVRSGATMQIASAAGEGATAAVSIREYLNEKDA